MNVRLSWLRIATVLVLPALALAGMPVLNAADEKPAAEAKKEGAAEKPAKKSPADYRGPLPAYYTRVIAPDQKDKIYAIQDAYEPQMAALQKQMKELLAKRDAEIEAVLTPEQREKVAAMKAERAKASAAGKKPAAKESTEAQPKTETPKASGN